MLQIIGWLGCLYLVVKGLEIVANPAFRTQAGDMNAASIGAALLAVLGAAAFSALLYYQGASLFLPIEHKVSGEELRQSIIAQCIERSQTPEEAANCGRRP